MDPKSLTMRAVAARSAGNMELYFKLLILSSEAPTMRYGPVIEHGPEDLR